VRCGDTAEANLRCNEGDDGILGDWGRSEATRRCGCARIGFYVPRAQSCAGSSATRLLIAAVDLGLANFRVQTGHEVSLWPEGGAWAIKGGELYTTASHTAILDLQGGAGANPESGACAHWLMRVVVPM